MSAVYIFDGAILDRVDYDQVELVEVADKGAVGQSTLVVDDTDTGTTNIVGLKTFRAFETDCEDQRTLSGFIGNRVFERGVAEASNARIIRVTVDDLNDLLNQRALTTVSAKRPRETVSARLNWLLSTDALGDLVTAGRIQDSTQKMDRNDHRNTFPGDILAECALAAGGFNFYVYQDPSSGAAKLAFRDDNASGSNTSPLKISNVFASYGSNIFPPMDDATLTRSPESVFSRAIKPYARGTVIEERAATASNYHRRDGIAPDSNVRSSERAAKQARDFLWQHKSEEDIVECEIEVPGGAVNLVHAGDRIQGQFGHWGPEGYSGWNYFRVLERRVKPLLSAQAPSMYRLRLRLSPQESAEPTCSYPRTPSATYYPLPNYIPDWAVYPFAVSDGVTYYLRPGIFYPTTPTPGQLGVWNFEQLNAGGVGGPGTFDYAGDCVQNQLRFILVGNGTLVVQTETYSGSTNQPTWGVTRPMAGSWGTGANPYLHAPSSHPSGTWTSGAAVTFTINDTTAPNDCVRLVVIGDGPGSPCGGKWGWSSAVWTQT